MICDCQLTWKACMVLKVLAQRDMQHQECWKPCSLLLPHSFHVSYHSQQLCWVVLMVSSRFQITEEYQDFSSCFWMRRHESKCSRKGGPVKTFSTAPYNLTTKYEQALTTSSYGVLCCAAPKLQAWDKNILHDIQRQQVWASEKAMPKADQSECSVRLMSWLEDENDRRSNTPGQSGKCITDISTSPESGVRSQSHAVYWGSHESKGYICHHLR